MSFFILIVCGKASFVYRDKDCDKDRAIDLSKINSFCGIIKYFEVLGTSLYLGLSLFQYFWFLGISLPMGQSFIKPSF
jgi:hypothetical protein